MYSLYKDPKGENIFSAPDSEKHGNTATAKSHMGTCTSNNLNIETDCVGTPPEKNCPYTDHKKEVEVSLNTLLLLQEGYWGGGGGQFGHLKVTYHIQHEQHYVKNVDSLMWHGPDCIVQH